MSMCFAQHVQVLRLAIDFGTLDTYAKVSLVSQCLALP